jgi:cell division protein FtsB
LEGGIMNNIISFSIYLTVGVVCLIIVYNLGRNVEREINLDQRKKYEELSNENKKLENDIRNKKQS